MKTQPLGRFGIFLTCIALVLGSMACEGPEGPTGPQGTQGLQGEQGLQGPTGTANVIYSEWVALSELEAATDTSFLARNYRKFDIPAPELSQEIIDRGTIQVYFKLNNAVLQLPITFGGANPIYITYSPFQPGVLSILSQNLDNTATNLNTSIEIRYILIPGGVAADMANQLDFNDYNTIIEYYDIEP